MADLIDYDSDLFLYDDEICYNSPDCQIIIEPEEIVQGESSGGSASAGYVAYPYFTPEQIFKWLETFKKKKIKISIKVKVNEKEHISITRVVEKDNLKDVKNLVTEIRNITGTILHENKKFIVKFNKVTKID